MMQNAKPDHETSDTDMLKKAQNIFVNAYSWVYLTINNSLHLESRTRRKYLGNEGRYTFSWPDR